jgi:hypothetical protein
MYSPPNAPPGEEEAGTPSAASVPWSRRDVWMGLAGLAVLLVGALALSYVIRQQAIDLNLGLLVSLAELLLLGPAWWLTVRKYRVGWDALGLRGFHAQALGLGCGLMIFSFAFNFFYSLLLSQFGLRVQPDLVPILAGLSSPWLLLVGGAIVAPIVEEIFFRGFVFAGLRDQYGWQKAAVVSSILFAIIHFTPTAVVPIVVLGYIFAYLYQRSGSIWPAILMHASSNALALGAAYVLATTNLGQ